MSNNTLATLGKRTNSRVDFDFDVKKRHKKSD